MENNNINNMQEESSFDFKSLFFLCISKWHWFVVCLAISMLVAVLYIKRTQPTYTRYSEILIKEDAKGKTMPTSVTSSFEDLGFFSGRANVNNEIIAFQSPALMNEVVRRLYLDYSYTSTLGLRKNVLYGTSLPVQVVLPDFLDKDATTFTIKFKDSTKVEISDFQLKDGKIKGTAKGHLNDTIISPIGKIIISKTLFYNDSIEYKPIYVTKHSIYSAANTYSGKLSVSLSNKEATVINLTVNDQSIQRADDVLNTVIAVYNENWIKDKNLISISTSRFIDRRLEVISQELGSVDEDISSFKSRNLLPDVQAASSMYMTQSMATTQQIMNLNTQKQMVVYIRDYLIDIANTNQLLPEFTGAENNNAISRQISEYNTLQLDRNKYIVNSSERNAQVVSMGEALAAMRRAILSSIDNMIVSLNTQIKSLSKSEIETTQRIAANPSQAKHLLSIERQQKIKEALYLYLLQKREENELSQAFTAYNTRVITPPTGSFFATTPKRRIILLAALLLGVAIPFGVAYLLEAMNVTVRGRKDLEMLTIPFIGEIPLSYKSKRQLIPRKPVKETRAIVVKEGNRNTINEAFRVVRTNLEFIAGVEKQNNVLMVSSLNPGAGKTFISMNLAMALAIKGNKVITVDLDMRKASLSTFVKSPKTGVSNYLSGHIDTLEEITVQGAHDNLSVIPVGTIPPNPTELLLEKRLEKMIAELRKKYDYVFIDCPPVEIVADAAIINKLTDITLFVIRTGLFNREMLPEVEKFYTHKKYRNMTVLLNGSSEGYGYGKYGYGYRYGYNYGYGTYSEKNNK
ncbi:MAG: polysaccharide biosynthesis tyrosine autokinase [Paludibacter sp.]|jgi:capsular exopolysaccharide synthesis family protein|nr:polysaccharide biosynthesis tyrosine autokinase [Paludibacter sp.]